MSHWPWISHSRSPPLRFLRMVIFHSTWAEQGGRPLMFQVGLLRGLEICIGSQIWLPLAANFLDLWKYMGAIRNDNNLRSPHRGFCEWLFSTQPEPSMELSKNISNWVMVELLIRSTLTLWKGYENVFKYNITLKTVSSGHIWQHSCNLSTVLLGF